MTDADDRHVLLARASNPRRATMNDAGRVARLFAAAFAADPVFDWLARRGAKRAEAMERFFLWLLQARAIPHGETWLADDGSAAAAWLPPEADASPGNLREQLSLLPVIMRLTGVPRLLRGSAMASAMDANHPKEPHFYLAFIGVAPRHQGKGLGSALLEATLARVDAKGLPAYLENSNPRNRKLYERAGFSVRREVHARRDAPSLWPMWRAPRKQIAVQGSSSESQ